MNSIAAVLNFKYVISPPSDGELWGAEVQPGVFSGLVGELQNEKSDVGWALLFITPDRYKYIEYTNPFEVDHLCYMVSKRLLLRGTDNTYLSYIEINQNCYN